MESLRSVKSSILMSSLPVFFILSSHVSLFVSVFAILTVEQLCLFHLMHFVGSLILWYKPKNGARPCSRTNLLSGSSARNCVLTLSSCVSRKTCGGGILLSVCVCVCVCVRACICVLTLKRTRGETERGVWSCFSYRLHQWVYVSRVCVCVCFIYQVTDPWCADACVIWWVPAVIGPRRMWSASCGYEATWFSLRTLFSTHTRTHTLTLFPTCGT